MDPWFADGNEDIRRWAWPLVAPVEDRDARCPPVGSRSQADAFTPAGVYEGPSGGSAPVVPRLSAQLRAAEYRPLS